MKTVVGLFDRFEDAQNAVRELRDVGFYSEDISMVTRDADGEYTRHLEGTSEGDSQDISDGAATGAGIGSILGGIGGFLVGLGALAIPGIGPVLAAGPLVAALAGAGIGAVAGGLVGALVDLGIPDQHADLYAEGVRRGGTLLVVRADDRKADLAMTIMNRNHPVEPNRLSKEWQDKNWRKFDPNAEPLTADELEFNRTGKFSQIPVTSTSELDYEDLHEDLHQHQNLEDRLVVDGDDSAAADTSDSFWNRNAPVAPSTGDPRIDRSNDVVGMDHATIPLTGATQDNPFVKEGKFDDVDYDAESSYQAHHRSYFGATGRDYAYYQPAYLYGFELRNNPQYMGADWDAVEPAARQEWELRGSESAWDEVKDAVRYAWNRVVG